MEDDPEMIRQRMEEKRTALSEKIEALESKMTGAVTGTTEAVTETVETVKESVQESVEAVAGAVQDTVRSVKETFDISRQFDRHPFAMLGGAVLLGFIGGRLLGPLTSRRGASLEDIRLRSGGEPMGSPASSTPAASYSAPSAAARDQGPSLVGEVLEPLKAVAVGAAMGLLRDMAVQYLPENLKDSVNETVNNLTGKMGGRTMPSFDINQMLSQFTGQNGGHGGESSPGSSGDLQTGQTSTATGPRERTGRF